jgi:hypothetical protein
MQSTGSQWRASKLTCTLTIALVFFTGAVAGAVVMDLSAHRWRAQAAPFWTETGREISLQKWTRELDLTPQQTKELERILDDFGMYYRNVLGEGKARIIHILNDDQKKKFDQLIAAQK